MVEWAKLNPAAVPLPYIVQQAFLAWFGFSTVVARAPAAIASVLGGIVFAWLLAGPLSDARGSVPGGLWTITLFLAAPLQFRYALEARGYSLGLLFSLLTLLIFLELCRRPSIGLALLYSLAIALGLYSQPFSLLPVAGQLIWLMRPSADRSVRNYVLIAAAAACATFVPWYLEQADAKRHYAHMAVYFFSWRQVTPWTLLHEFPGGGYLPSIALFALAGYALSRESLKNPREQLLLSMAAVSICAPILADAADGYFFAARQLLFALPPIILLAGAGLDRLFAQRRGVLALAGLTVFLIPSAIKDYRDAVVPKDDLAATADRIETELAPDACLLIAPRNEIAYYSFFHPGLQLRACPERPDSETVLASDTGQYTTTEERAAMSAVLASEYRPERSIRVGRAQITLYRRRR
jgi:4-amino-4-deoxy-L-arabinose transferase-like glycosyltransferase